MGIDYKQLIEQAIIAAIRESPGLTPHALEKRTGLPRKITVPALNQLQEERVIYVQIKDIRGGREILGLHLR